MPYAATANQLIDAPTPHERSRIVSGVEPDAARAVAEAVREICIADWASDPARVQRAAVALRALFRAHGSDAVHANSRWVTGIAEITKGRFAAAVEALDAAIAIFTRLGRSVDAARTKVSRLLALAMLSRYDEAIRTGLEAIPVLVRHGEQLAAGKIEMNLSNIVSRRALHTDAERYCRSARRRFIKAGEPSWQAMAENGLANTYAELNDFERAEKYYKTALSTAIAAGMLVTEAEIEASIGNLALLRGRYADALRHLEMSRRKFETLDMPHQTAIADLEMADIYAELNLNAEAEEIYDHVCEAFRRLKLRAEEARARLNYGRAAHHCGSTAAAKRQLRRALQLFALEKNLSGQAAAMLEQAQIALDGGRYADALATANDARRLIVSGQNAGLTLSVGHLAGEAFRRGGRLGEARAAFGGVLADAKRLRRPDAQQRALTALGKIAGEEGDDQGAERSFKRAISLVERLRAPLASEEFGMAFLAARLEPYDLLARLYIKKGRVADAFRAVESGRSRALADALGGRDTGIAADSKLGEDLARVREELNSYYKRLDRADDGEAAELRAAAYERESAVAKLMRQIASTSAAADGPQAAAADTGKLLKQLNGATLVEFVEYDGEFSAFVLSGAKVRFVRGVATRDSVEDALGDLHFQFGTLRYGMAGMERFAAEMKARTDACLRKLYDLLLRPVEKLISGERLIIVPAGPLHYVPFHALHDGTSYAVERFETSCAPSAGVWSMLHERRGRRIRNALLMGYADERIPLVEDEISAVGRIMPQARALKGEAAGFAAFVREAPKSDLIHLACHGQFRAENPMFSSLHLADGWVTVRDICSARIKAEIVTLSACETGLNKIYAGDEILGLARGFLTAGASSLVVSLWAVNDAAAGRLMEAFYRAIQRGMSAPASLRQAQLDAIGRGEHPFMWSPFVSIGK